MVKTHYIKTVNPYFQELWDGNKTFEIRKEDDRVYSVEDDLALQEYNPITGLMSGREIHAEVTYVLRDKPYVPKGYVCMAIKEFYRKQ